MTNDAIARPIAGVSNVKSATWPGLVVALVVLIAWLGVWVLGDQSLPAMGHTDETISYFWSYAAAATAIKCLVVAAILWAVLYFASVRRANPKASGRYFFTLLIVGLLIAAPLALLGAAANQNRLAQLAMRQMTQTFNQSVKADRAGYKAEMAALALDQVLSPAQLNAGRGLPEARLRIAQARRIDAKYEVLEISQAVAKRAEIEKSDLAPPLKARYLAAFDQHTAQATALRQQQKDIENRALSEAEALVDLLTRTRGTWFVAGDSVIFSRMSDLNQFNQRQQTLRAIRGEAAQFNETVNQTVQP